MRLKLIQIHTEIHDLLNWIMKKREVFLLVTLMNSISWFWNWGATCTLNSGKGIWRTWWKRDFEPWQKISIKDFVEETVSALYIGRFFQDIKIVTKKKKRYMIHEEENVKTGAEKLHHKCIELKVMLCHITNISQMHLAWKVYNLQQLWCHRMNGVLCFGWMPLHQMHDLLVLLQAPGKSRISN